MGLRGSPTSPARNRPERVRGAPVTNPRRSGGLFGAVAAGSLHGLKNHEGKGVEIVGEARPARWQLKASPQERDN
jgi:hypothetical protein